MSLVELPKEVVTCRNLVGGSWIVPERAELLDVTSPYTGGVIGRVPMTPPAEVAYAVDAAHEAFPGWSATPLRERTQVMFRFRELLLANVERLGQRAAAESGKTLAEARAGVLKGAEVCEFATSLQNLDGGGAMEVSRNVFCEYRREPLGVVAGIVPFNFPAMVPLWMLPIALTVGNCFVLKPSEKVPMTSQLLAELLHEAGLPRGVLSIVNGGRATVDALIAHPGIAAVGFVGSTAAARHVYAAGSSAGKRVLALGGAKNHVLVVPDADPAIAAQGVVDSFTGCAGQRCMAASVLVAVGEVQSIIDAIVARAASIELGPQMGAIIDRASVERIEQAIAGAQAGGAQLVLDGRGKQPSEGAYSGGNWVGPSILDHVAAGSDLALREVFGPVLAIIRAPTLSAAIAIANGSGYGNAASVFTTSGAVAQQVAEGARAGMIGVNVGVPVPREPFSFGGVGLSKFGHGDITGASSLDFWSDVKKITRKWSSSADASWMS